MLETTVRLRDVPSPDWAMGPTILPRQIGPPLAIKAKSSTHLEMEPYLIGYVGRCVVVSSFYWCIYLEKI